MTEAGYEIYQDFSPDGLAGFKLPEGQLIGSYEDMPYIRITQDLGGTPEEAALTIADQFTQKNIQYGYFRAVLHTPEWYAQVLDCLSKQFPDDHYCYLEPHEFFLLLKYHFKKSRKSKT